jgi:hypothetical protein
MYMIAEIKKNTDKTDIIQFKVTNHKFIIKTKTQLKKSAVYPLF